MRLRFAVLALALLCSGELGASGLDASRLGVVYSLEDPHSREVALIYAAQRSVPAGNVVGIHIPHKDVILPTEFGPLRENLLDRLPTNVQSLALVWSRPFAVGCMSITTAIAAGYHAAFCEPGCEVTERSPLFDSDGWLPADSVGWWPAMMLPSEDVTLAIALIKRGAAADGSAPTGTLYLVNTQDNSRNVRAASYPLVANSLARRLQIVQLATPVQRDIVDAIGYFTGVAQVEELSRLHFRPGAPADHLTSVAGALFGGGQMSALAWLQQGATGSYGNVSEPCNRLQKFPDIAVLMRHYTQGETLLEAYWKSVEMPGQGLFVGEPLSRPYAAKSP